VLKSGSFWKDSLNFCNSIFKCHPSHKGWKKTSSIAVSTKYNHLNTQLKLDGKPSAVKNNGNQLVIYGASNNNTVYNNSMTGGNGRIKITSNSSEKPRKQ
jgi:hypothetical protein